MKEEELDRWPNPPNPPKDGSKTGDGTWVHGVWEWRLIKPEFDSNTTGGTLEG